MSHPERHDRNDGPEGAGTPRGRRLGRILIPLAILLVILGIFAYILLVAQSGPGDEQVYDNEGAGPIPAPVAVAET